MLSKYIRRLFETSFKKNNPIFITNFLNYYKGKDVYYFIFIIDKIRYKLSQLSNKSPYLFSPEDTLNKLLKSKVIHDDGDIEDILVFFDEEFSVSLDEIYIMDMTLVDLSKLILSKFYNIADSPHKCNG